MGPVSLVGGDTYLRQSVETALGPVNFLDSVIDCFELDPSQTLLIPESLSECSGLELVKVLNALECKRPRLVLISIDFYRRDEAFESGVDEFFILPFSTEFKSKLINLPYRRDSSLSGTSVDFPLHSVLQFLFSTRETGVLILSTGSRLYFNDGELIHARGDNSSTNKSSALEEIKKLLSDVKNSKFEFFSFATDDIPRTIDVRTDHLLLALASQIDEDSQ